MRASRSVQDSAKPCRAWARSPTIVRLRDGQRRSSICHSASVSSCASSTTTCANGPASRSTSAVGQRARRRPARSAGRRGRASTPGRRRTRRRPTRAPWCAGRRSPRPSGRARGPPRPAYAVGAATPRDRRAAAGRRRAAAGRRTSTPRGRRDAAPAPRRARARARSGGGRPGTVQRSPTRSVCSISGHARSKVSRSPPCRSRTRPEVVGGELVGRRACRRGS